MENFKEIAEKCLKGELSGTFITRIGEKIPSYKLKRSNHVVYRYQFDTVKTYSDEGRFYLKCVTSSDIVDFIPLKDMETKEIKIEVPEGYEIDKENSSFERIVFKKKEIKYPESWDDCTCRFSIGFKTGFNPSEFIANLMEKTSAYTKLLCLRHEWIHIWSKKQGMEKDWEPVFDRGVIGAGIPVILVQNGMIMYSHNYSELKPLSFPTVELAESFIKKFRDLLEQAKGLY